MSKKKVLLRGVFINRDTNGEGVLKVGTTLIRVSTVMGILYGVRLKYENVSFTLSVGDVAKIQTAPKGNNSNTIVKAGKTAKQTFFMLYISFTNSLGYNR